MMILKLRWLIPFFLLTTISCSVNETSSHSDKPYHHLDGGFRNPEGSPPRNVSLGTRLSFFLSMARGPEYKEGDIDIKQHVLDQDQAATDFSKANSKDSITWIGHATFLVRLDGITVLTDPIFSNRASPLSWAGPERLFKPGLALEDLPPIDLVIISHAHYDHFDLKALAALPGRDQTTVVVPLGLAKYLGGFGYKKVVEVDWYDQIEVPSNNGSFVLTAYPAVHWSNRTPFDINKSLWMSYGFSAGGHSIFHSGDTEKHETLFQEIGEAMQTDHGGCDIGLLSIGAYTPRAMMDGVHVTPEAANQVGEEVGCRKLVPMHWGTFLLSLEPAQEPIERFEKEAGDTLLRLKIGETMLLKQLDANVENSN